MMNIRKRNLIIRIKRRRKPNTGDKRSPCSGCPREDKSKNTKLCNTCKAPRLYADMIERRGAYVKAIDYREPLTIGRAHLVKNFLDEVKI